MEQRSLSFLPLNLSPQTLSLTERVTRLSCAEGASSRVHYSQLSGVSEDIVPVLGGSIASYHKPGGCTVNIDR